MQVLEFVKPNLLTILAVLETNQRRFHALILATSVTPDTELIFFFFFFFFYYYYYYHYHYYYYYFLTSYYLNACNMAYFVSTETHQRAHDKMIKFVCVIKCVHQNEIWCERLC